MEHKPWCDQLMVPRKPCDCGAWERDAEERREQLLPPQLTEADIRRIVREEIEKGTTP